MARDQRHSGRRRARVGVAPACLARNITHTLLHECCVHVHASGPSHTGAPHAPCSRCSGRVVRGGAAHSSLSLSPLSLCSSARAGARARGSPLSAAGSGAKYKFAVGHRSPTFEPPAPPRSPLCKLEATQIVQAVSAAYMGLDSGGVWLFAQQGRPSAACRGDPKKAPPDSHSHPLAGHHDRKHFPKKGTFL